MSNDIFPLPTDHAAVAKLIASFDNDVELTMDNTYLSSPAWKKIYRSIASQLKGNETCGGKKKGKYIPKFDDFCDGKEKEDPSFRYISDKEKIMAYVHKMSRYYFHTVESNYFKNVSYFLFYLKKEAPMDTLSHNPPYLDISTLYDTLQVALYVNNTFTSVELNYKWRRFLRRFRKLTGENYIRTWPEYVWKMNKQYFSEESKNKIDELIREYRHRFNRKTSKKQRDKPLGVDLVGLHVGRWHIISEAEPENGRRTWQCRCACGTYKKLSRDDLLRHSGRRIAFSCGSCSSKRSFPIRFDLQAAQDQTKQKFANAKYQHAHHGGPAVKFEDWMDIIRFNGLPLPGEEDLDRRGQERLAKDTIMPYAPGTTRWEAKSSNRVKRRATKYLFTIYGAECRKKSFADLAGMTGVPESTLRTWYSREGATGFKSRVKDLLKQCKAA